LTPVNADAHCQQAFGTLHAILRRPGGLVWLWIVTKQGPNPRFGRCHRITAKDRRTLGIARGQPAELGTEMKPLES
jgi:hypothetical protein